MANSVAAIATANRPAHKMAVKVYAAQAQKTKVLLTKKKVFELVERLPVNCDYGSCRAHAIHGSRYCEQHQKPAPAHADIKHEKKLRENEPGHQWYALAVWKALSKMVRNQEPVCQICHRRPSKVCDHIRPHKGIWALFLDRKNLQALCAECHSIKTAKEDGGFGNAPDTSGLVTTGETGKQFISSSVGEDALNRALAED